MRKVGRIVHKEFIQLRRDRRMLAILFIAPVLQLILLGYAANLDIKNIPVVFCDLDGTATSRNFISRFPHSGYFILEGIVSRLADIDDAIIKGRASLAVVLPKGMGRKLAGGESARVQLIVDGAESQSAVVALHYASMIATAYSRQVLLEKAERFSPRVSWAGVNPQIRVWYNPELRSRNFMIPGVLGLLLMVMTMMLTSLGIVKEKEMGTLEQLIVTPVRPKELILGKLLPFFLIGLIDIVLVVAVAVFWFKVPIKGDVFLLFGLSPLFMLTTLGLGLFISTVSKNQQQAMLSAVFFMIPMMILSGFVFPIQNMPKLIQFFTYLVPLRYYLVIIRGLFLKAVGLEVLWQEALALLVFGLAILGLSVLRFKKKIE
ncbi:MAG: ABC transporter permease [Clostridiales bacterium]|nr:ABC transporter permease [Clostridiales bacterium]